MKKLILMMSLSVMAFSFTYAQDSTGTNTTPATTEISADITPEVVNEELLENPFIDPVMLEKVKAWEAILFGGVNTIFVYLSFLFPGLKSFKETGQRAAVSALILAGIFITLGFGNGVTVAIGYFLSSALYDWVLSRFKKTPAPTPATT